MDGSNGYVEILNLFMEQLRLLPGLGDLDEHDRLGSLALDSVDVAKLMAAFGSKVGLDLQPTLFWAHPTPAELARHIAGLADSARAVRATRRFIDPLVITGLACRFPGAADANAFWHLLATGRDFVAPMPPGRFHEFPSSRWHVHPEELGGFLDEVSAFDHAKFGIGAHEASCMDPQQRLLLEISWAALENAGMDPTTLQGQRGGVYVGAMWSDFAHHVTPEEMTAQSATGIDSSILSARLSFVFGLNGPCLTVNTACSSSLVALHLACQALKNDECDFAIVAGVNLLLAAQSFEAMRRFGGLSEDGRCHTFDAAANGYVRAEGCGVIVVKPLPRALAEASPIWGVIRSTVTNTNGFHASLTAPSVNAQATLLREACIRADLHTSEIRYVEAHGTGTAMGDPIEVSAISAALCAGVERPEPLWIGSVKTNIGHTEAAAGMAGLIKVLLSMRHGLIPAHLHYKKQNPLIDWAKLGLQLVTEARPWGSGNVICGVSSFGFGGTNAHVIVSETWPDSLALAATPTSARARDDGSDRAKESPLGAADGRSLLVFSGQGSQWVGMGRSYARLHPSFREVIRRCDQSVQKIAGWSLAQRLFDEGETFSDVRIGWPCNLAMQLALTEVWLAKGLRPSGVIGHSIGEVAAAQVAGLIDLEEAFCVIRAQAEWASRHPGAMALVGLDWAAARNLLEEMGAEVTCAIQHSEFATVITGTRRAILEVQGRCRRRNTRFDMINGSVSVHAGQGLDDCQHLLDMAGGGRRSAACLPFYSGSRGGAPLETLSNAYWSTSITQPFRWFDALRTATRACRGLVVEVAPHPILKVSIRDALKSSGIEGNKLESGRRGCVDGAAMEQMRRQLPPVPPIDPWNGWRLLLLSAPSVDGLRQRCRAIAQWLAGDHSPGLDNCTRALAQRSILYSCRATLVVNSCKDAIARLNEMAEDPGLPARDVRRGGRQALVLDLTGVLAAETLEWLTRFPRFVAEYRRLRSASGSKGDASDAAAQHGACVALMEDFGLSFADFISNDAKSHVGVILQERPAPADARLTRTDDRAPVVTLDFAAVERSSRVKDHVLLSLSSTHLQASSAGRGDDPARAFLELMAKCYRAGSEIAHTLGRGWILSILPTPYLRAGERNTKLARTRIYRIAWQQQLEISVARQPRGRVLVIASHEIEAQLRARQILTDTDWYHPEDFSQAGLAPSDRFRSIARQSDADSALVTWDRVILFWQLEDPVASAVSSIDTVLMLLQSKWSMGDRRPVLHVITSGAQKVQGSEVNSPAAAMAWGLIRTAQLELREVGCTIVDIDPVDSNGRLSEGGLKALSDVLNVDLDQSAWRDGKLFAPVLVEDHLQPLTRRVLTVSLRGFHLITGGFGAFGLELLRSLFERGERRFLLVGRSPPDDIAQEVIDGLSAAGARIDIHLGSVTDYEGLNAVVRESAGRLGPLSAVTHAAGVLDSGPLATTSSAEFEASLAAKVIGAKNLHMISADWPVEQFTLISSVSSLFGFPGYAAYAASNSYLDGLAEFRNRLGLPGLSVCFGPFSAKGLLSRVSIDLDLSLLENVSMREGVELLNQRSGAEGVLAIMRYRGPTELGRKGRDPAAHAADSISAGQHAGRRDKIRDVVAALLRRSAGSIPLHTPLSELGVNSLLGVEIRNRLQSEYRVRLPATTLWDYPTVSAVSEYLGTLLGEEAVVAPSDPIEVRLPTTPGKTDDSDEALLAQLLQELTTLENAVKGDRS